jgi:hypothetical protein
MRLLECTDFFKAWIDHQLALEYTLAEPVSDKVGLWSKTDSTSYFKDYIISPQK